MTFCRPQPSLAQSPTLVEVIEAGDLDPGRPLSDVVPNVAGLALLQGDRPLKTHGMPIASSAVDALIDRVRGRGLRHWVQPSSDSYPFPRLWMGISADDLAGYRTGGDGGLMVEVVHTDTLRLPPAAFTANPLPEDSDADVTRTAARCFLVEDLDRSLTELADTFDWEPEAGPERADDGSRRALLGFRLRQSALVELLEPSGDREEAAFLKRWGPGVWAVRIGVSDVPAKADDLRSSGTPFEEIRTGFAHPDVVLRVNPAVTPGCLFEFAALP